MAVEQCGQGDDGFDVAAVPAPVAFLETERAGSAARLCGTAADLPALVLEIQAVDHLLPQGDLVQQLDGGLAFLYRGRRAEEGSPRPFLALVGPANCLLA